MALVEKINYQNQQKPSKAIKKYLMIFDGFGGKTSVI